MAGAMAYLTQATFLAACQFLLRMEDANVAISINLTRTQLLVDGMVERFVQMVQDTGCRLDRYIIEVTEAEFLEEEPVRTVLNRFRALGIRIALDDFGSGYSSLSCLDYLPIDLAKLDKGFLRNSRDPAATIRELNNIFAPRGIEMIVEGVETAQDLKICVDSHVCYVQGYFLGRPEPDAPALARLTAPLRSRDGAPDSMALAPAD
jgi:EAL domain-containing protein (putative c-di-GMP-specific phosphodiesterase class I)